VRAVLALILVAIALAPGGSVDARFARPIVIVGANQSLNWAGYMQGSLAKSTTFHAITAEWIVPKVRAHVAGQAESSASWIGIGGGCLDSACTLFDSTLIQAGVEHEVDEAGHVSYYTWWETIPGPQIKTELAVSAGDRVRVEIVESTATPQLWTISIANVTSGGVFTLTLPYTSTYGSAEWVIETPVVITESGVRIGPMPELARVRFDVATVNGAPAQFIPAEQIQLVDWDLSIIAAPSLPDREADGFNDCTYRHTCPTPGSPLH
jgi:hypothetical protein